MKTYLIFTVISLCLFGCVVDDRKYYPYTTAIRNTSDKPFHILILGNGENWNTPVYDTLVNTTLNAGEIAFKNSYSNPRFSGMHNGTYVIRIYKIVFTDTNKGYICEKDSVNNLCFQNKVSLTEAHFEKDFTFENDVYYYDITQEDYENAHVLP